MNEETLQSAELLYDGVWHGGGDVQTEEGEAAAQMLDHGESCVIMIPPMQLKMG